MFSFTAQVLCLVISVTTLCQGRPNIGINTGDYSKTDDCMDEQTCIYDYNATVVQSNGEEIDVSATVGLFCESTGVFKGEAATRSCITVSNAVVMVVTDEENSDDKRRHDFPDKEMSGWFCFVQSSSSGKILGVFYPKDENEGAVNFKKSIVSAFQVNYKGSALANETDLMSQHTSHYNYTSNGDKQVQQRTVNDSDVQEYAGNSKSPKQMITFHQKDEIEVGSNNRVYYSRGETVIELSSKKDPDTIGDEDDDDSTSQDIPALGATISYQIQLLHCKHQSNHRHTRSVYTAAMSSSERVTDDLLAKKDQVKQDYAHMKELNDNLPSLDETITRVQRDVDKNAAGRLVGNWNEILEMESKYGPLSGTQAKLPQLIERLQKQSKVNISSTSIERMFLYHLLSSEGSLKAQKELLEMLHYPLTEEERSDLLMEIALLSSAHASTVDYLITYFEQLDNGDDRDQLILSLATLGRHSNVEEKIVNLLSKKLRAIQDHDNNTASVIHVIHALGNTGSKKMIPVLIPFLSAEDPQLQLVAIDALRTVTMEKQVQEAFVTVVKNAVYAEQVVEVVESLTFPFQHSLYFSDEPEDYTVEQSLLEILLEAAVKFQNVDLHKALRTYASYINDQYLSEQLQQHLTRERRASTTNWNSNSDSGYNLVASRSSRTNDEQNYPYHRGYLWTKKIGNSKIHLKAAAGGFGGIGVTGFKLYARGKVNIYAWSKTFTVLDTKYSYKRDFSDIDIDSILPLYIDRYVRAAGSTLRSYYGSTTTATLAYSKNWHRSARVFYVQYSFFIYAGTLDVYIEGRLNGDVSFNANIVKNSGTASFAVTPSVTVTGGGRVNVVEVTRIGFEVSANVGYKIEPEASATVCDTSPVGDATACFEVYTQPKASISIYAYWQTRSVTCRWRSWSLPSCSFHWGSKNKVSSLSATYNIGSSRRSLLTGYCRVCDCTEGNLLNLLCDGPVSSESGDMNNEGGCSCYNQYAG